MVPNLILYLTLILIPPIPGATIVKDFDLPINFYGSGHRGIDYLSKVNEPVLASADGYVSHQGLIANRWTISITHSQFRTTYEPVRPIVKLGQIVKSGEIIGYLELKGSHCFPQSCLHFGLKEGKFYFNPVLNFKRNYPKLLPIYS